MDFVLAQALAGLEVERYSAGLIARREDLGQAWLQIEYPKFPVLQRASFLSIAVPTGTDAIGSRPIDQSTMLCPTRCGEALAAMMRRWTNIHRDPVRKEAGPLRTKVRKRPSREKSKRWAVPHFRRAIHRRSGLGSPRGNRKIPTQADGLSCSLTLGEDQLPADRDRSADLAL